MLTHGDIHHPVAGGSNVDNVVGGHDVARGVGHTDSQPGVLQPGQVGQALPQADDSFARRR